MTHDQPILELDRPWGRVAVYVRDLPDDPAFVEVQATHRDGRRFSLRYDADELDAILAALGRVRALLRGHPRHNPPDVIRRAQRG